MMLNLMVAPYILLGRVRLKFLCCRARAQGEGGRDPFFNFGDPFAGFGGFGDHKSLLSNFF